MDTVLKPIDLSSCDREPIHVPGSIQPHGIMLVADVDGFRVRQVAGDVERRLGAAAWQGQKLEALVGEVICARLAGLTEPGAVSRYLGQLKAPTGEVLDVSAYLCPPYVIVELEPASSEQVAASLMLDRLAGAASGFELAGSLTALCERAAIEFRRLTGFDRVMIYHFVEDGAGRVLAEDRREDQHSFLNHHFPAGDIPHQARALYLRNLIRVIPDVAYQPAPLRPAVASSPASDLPLLDMPPLDMPLLDMSDSNLRSVSPMHLQYLGNMGVHASASVSIVKDGVLWGLIACHNETPRLLPYDIRAACRSLAGNLARQIKAKEEAEGYRQRIRLRSFEDDIVALLSREGSLDEALSNHLKEIGRMMGGDGVAVLRGRELVVSGVCPAGTDIRALAAWVQTRLTKPVFSTDHLSELYPPAETFQQTGSGLLAITLSTEEPWVLLWFRVEKIVTVQWAGNPHKAVVADAREPLTPRASFDAWQETVRGRATDWTMSELDAATRLRAALLDVRQNRRVRELNRQLTKILQDKDVLLQQKEFLITEVNHRVQNSLQLVSSFMALQSRASDNTELHTALEEARRRLTAVAAVHRRLYRGDQIEVVDAARYIEELCADTFSFMGQDWAQHLTLNLGPVMVSTDRAVTLGLVLTELMINSNKYAYGGAAGPIEIGLSEDRTHVHMIVADKGGGRISKRKGFGSRIIDGLVSQLGGTLAYSDNHPGSRTEITMPTQLPKRPV
jgi:chemotaxis family two-component system sensor kinase Cph1